MTNDQIAGFAVAVVLEGLAFVVFWRRRLFGGLGRPPSPRDRLRMFLISHAVGCALAAITVAAFLAIPAFFGTTADEAYRGRLCPLSILMTIMFLGLGAVFAIAVSLMWDNR